MLKELIVTSYSPSDLLKLSNLSIVPNKRVEHLSRIRHNCDSFYVEVDKDPEEEREILNKFVAFHTFVFDNHFTLSSYEKENRFQEVGENALVLDYSNLTKKIYRFEREGLPVLSYSFLYEKFLSIAIEDYDLVRSFLNTYQDKDYVITDKEIRDDSFIKILISFSIIESIIGQQDFCVIGHNCAECGKEGIQHYRLSQKEWVKKRFEEIIGTEENVQSEYFDVFMLVRNKIRHKVVHEGFFPRTAYVIEEDDEVIYDTNRIKEDALENKTTLRALSLVMQDMARNLLLDHIFQVKIFPPLRPLRTKRIGA